MSREELIAISRFTAFVLGITAATAVLVTVLPPMISAAIERAARFF